VALRAVTLLHYRGPCQHHTTGSHRTISYRHRCTLQMPSSPHPFGPLRCPIEHDSRAYNDATSRAARVHASARRGAARTCWEALAASRRGPRRWPIPPSLSTSSYVSLFMSLSLFPSLCASLSLYVSLSMCMSERAVFVTFVEGLKYQKHCL
jgi:hypothetical protein